MEEVTEKLLPETNNVDTADAVSDKDRSCFYGRGWLFVINITSHDFFLDNN
jgi:hypothetical protein